MRLKIIRRLLLLGLVVFAAPTCASLSGSLATVSKIQTVALDAQTILSTVDLLAGAYFAAHPNQAAAEQYAAVATTARGAVSVVLRAGGGLQELDKGAVDAALADFTLSFQQATALLDSLGVFKAQPLRARASGEIAPGPSPPFPAPLALTFRLK